MLVSLQQQSIIDNSGYEIFERYYSDGEKIVVYYNGLVFIRGARAQDESISLIVEQYKNNGKINFRDIFGSYVLIITDSKSIIVFSDNSNMHGIYRSKNYLSSSIAEIGALTGGKINNKALCEYLTFHRSIYTDTIIEGVDKLPANEYLVINKKTDSFQYKDKKIGDIDNGSNIDNPKAFFRDFAKSIDRMKSIAALTGGFDSRLVACMINKYKKTDCFISGDNDEGADIICSKKTAEAAGFKWDRIIPPSPKEKADELVKKIYKEGQYKVEINSSGYRINYFMSILDKKYDILLSGNAGDMHKGFWDIRTIPFYPRGRKADMHKFARKYFISPSTSIYLGDSLKDEYNIIERETYTKFDRLIKDTVLKSCLCGGWCDWVPYSLQNTQNSHLHVYSPLQEYELVKYSYSIAPKGKRMNMFHRRLISYYNKPASRVRSIYRTSCSDNLIYLLCDYFSMIEYYVEGFVKMISRKLFNTKSHLNKSVQKEDLMPLIRSSKIANDSVEWGREKGYISGKFKIDSIPDEILRKIIYSFLLFHEVNDKIREHQ